MIHHQSPPPSDIEACLCHRYPSSQKGGTIIIEGVRSLSEHERILDSGGYRLDSCLRCGGTVHLHDLRPRVMVAGAGAARTRNVTETQRIRCADRKECGAAWQLLPAFLARHLWRSWSTVERATLEQPAAKAQERQQGRTPTVPKRTEGRWRARLLSAAALLVTVVASTDRRELVDVAGAVGLDSTREQLVTEYARRLKPPPGQRLASVAELIHRLAPGVRLM